MIHVFGDPEPPVPRLLSQLAHRGHVLGRPDGEPSGATSTLVLTARAALDAMALAVLLGAWRKTPRARVLVISSIGAHRDARVERLRRLWELEENVRATRLPLLVLRLGALVGPDSPLWLRLRSGASPGRQGAALVQPVLESEVVDSLDRALRGAVAWEGWFELVGPEVLTLAELSELASAPGPARGAERGEWEPELEELATLKLAENQAWRSHFGLEVRPVSAAA
ncbi:MAG: hypothetical protein HOP12_09540, partial [Candidatus Eisenbacteria bacterium]|nr:hypothetical protein [Candidatus Eisenbacteria bacterium]